MVVTTEELEEAVTVLRRGGLVAFPTETVYGLGCDARNRSALHRLYTVKGRPPDHPVIVHLPGPEALADWAAHVPPAAKVLAEACWPGPLTIVVPRGEGVPDEVTGGREGVALRVPNQRVALALLESFGGGIAAPSANRFGRVSPTTAEDVRTDLDGDVDVVLDDGPCSVGVESTIVDCTGPDPVILRLGGCPVERIEGLLDQRVRREVDGRAAPGTLPAHYAPAARVELVDHADVPARVTALLDRGEQVGVLALDPPPDLPRAAVVLEAPADADEYARVLYARLREADRLDLDAVVAVAPPDEGVGAAVADRLRRAAASRPA